MDSHSRGSRKNVNFKSHSGRDYDRSSRSHRSRSETSQNSLLDLENLNISDDFSSTSLPQSAVDFLAICENLTQRKISNFDDSINVVSDLVASNKKSQLQLEMLQNTKQDLVSKLNDTNKALNNTTTEVQNLRNMLKKQMGSNPEAQTAQKLKKDISNLEKQLLDKDKVITQLTEQLSYEKRKNTELYSEQSLANSKTMSINEELRKSKENEQTLKNENTQFLKQISKLRKQLEHQNKYGTDDFQTLKSDFNKLKKLHKNLHDEYDALSQQNSLLQSRILELEKENQTLHEKIVGPLTTEVAPSQIQNTNEIEKLKQENSNLLQNISLSEEIIESQRNEIIKAYESRNTMSKLLNRLFRTLQQEEKLCQEYKLKYETLTYSIEDEKQKNEVSQEKLLYNFTNMFEQIMEIVPMDITEPIVNDPSKTEYEQLKAIVQELVYLSNNSKATSKLSDESTANIVEEYAKLQRRYVNIYSFLDNTLLFLRKVANTNDVDERLFIQQQLARIAIFIDQNKPDNVIYYPSPYECTDLNEALQIVNDFIDEDITHQSPYMEVISLLSAMVTANAMLMENAEINKRRVIELKDNATVNENLKAMVAEAKKLAERENTLKMIFVPLIGEDKDPLDWIKENIHDVIMENKYGKDKLAELKEKLETVRNAAQSEIRRLEKEKEEFCEKMTILAETAQNEILAAKVEFAKELDTMKIAQEESKAKTELQTALNDVNEKHEKEVNELKKANEELQSNVDELLNRVSKLTNDVQEREELIAEQHMSHEDYKAEKDRQVEDLMRISKSLMKKNKNAKQRLSEVNESIEKTIRESQQREVNAIENYKRDIIALSEKLQAANDEIANNSTNNSALEDKIKELNEQIAKLTLSERTYKHKYNTLSDSVVREREEMSASKAALSAAFEANHKEVVKQKDSVISQCREFIAKVAREVDEGQELMDLIAKAQYNIDTREDSPVIKAGIEALQLKRDFMIPIEKPLADTMRSLIDAKDMAQKDTEDINNKYKRTETELNKVRRELAKSCAAIADNKEWLNWARTMYMNVTCGAAPMYNANDLRYLLQESLLTEIGFASLTKKVDLLRSEKACLLSPHFKNATNYKKEPTVRVALLIVLFANRVQASASLMPIRFARIQTME